MSIIAWDGKTIASDRMAVNSDMQKLSTKLRDVRVAVLGWTGTISAGLAMAKWWTERHEARASNMSDPPFPEIQRTNDWSPLIIAYKLGGVFVIEQAPIEIPVLDPFAAWGAGRDFAIGAMAMGADAATAVRIASRFSVFCGNGVDVYDLTKL